MKKLVFFLLAVSVLMSEEIPFFNKHILEAPNAKAILVKDTDSALGRMNEKPKKLDLETLVNSHGHLCDGLVLSFVELSALFDVMFPDGVVDRTDLRVVAKNSPCLVDTSAIMSGARLNHKTLSLDNKLGGSFIVQRISTGDAYKVELKEKGFLKELKDAEKKIKQKNKTGQTVTAKEIDTVEVLANKVNEYLLYTDTRKFIKISKLKDYKFVFSVKDFGARSDVVNKNVGRN